MNAAIRGVLLSALLPAHVAAAFPPYVAADPSAPVVTEQNLLANERFWPYQLELTRSWQPDGRAQPLPAGTRGVLVRVEDSGAARIDFGRHGRYEVPVARTDLVALANRIRRGELDKLAPNFVHAIGPRLADSASESPRSVAFDDVFEPPGFLAVFADPDAVGFGELAAALAPLHGRHGVWTVLFPQGGHPDLEVREQLRALEWRVPFVFGYMTEGYTRSRLQEGSPLPFLMLQTREGRVVFQEPWRTGVVPELTSAVDRTFASNPAATAVVDRGREP